MLLQFQADPLNVTVRSRSPEVAETRARRGLSGAVAVGPSLDWEV
jgi:hypothetical protein